MCCNCWRGKGSQRPRARARAQLTTYCLARPTHKNSEGLPLPLVRPRSSGAWLCAWRPGQYLCCTRALATATPRCGLQRRGPRLHRSPRRRPAEPSGGRHAPRRLLFRRSRDRRDARQTGTDAVIRHTGLAVAAARHPPQPAAAPDSVLRPEATSRMDRRHAVGARHRQRRRGLGSSPFTAATLA
jgi:hypothetical protein